MNDYEIILSAIKKAKKNGWSPSYHNEYPNISSENLAKDIADHKGQYRKLIFQRGFAKAFFGEKPTRVDGRAILLWSFHLREMVLESKPLRYLERFI